MLFSRNNFKTLLSVTPHATHTIQRLVKDFYEPLKAAYAQEVDKRLITNPGQAFTQMQVAVLFRAAY
jgi:hypothetical protein